jgi:cell division protein FtsI/penicillin-binding protein 2
MRRSRVLVAAAGLLLGLVVLWLRLAYVQLVRHAYYHDRAEALQEQRVLLRPVRGAILDRRGRPLARDLLTYSVSAAPREMRAPRETARRLADILGLDARRLQREFQSRPRFLWVARHVPPARAQAISRLDRRGLYLALETQRVYPLGATAGELLGRTDLDNTGVEGLEFQFDALLRGQPGWATLFRDGHGGQHNLPRGLKREPEDGRTLVLTLDADLQAVVEGHLAAAVDSLHARRGAALFLDPATGQILALACWPHGRAGLARNLVVCDQYEPGSTFKLVVLTAALEEALASEDDVYDAENGSYRFARGATIRDVHHYGLLTLADAFTLSSNIVMGKLALRVGSERLYRYATSMGFGSLTGIEFPGEAAGLLRPPDRWSGRSLPTIAIGQEVSCTPLQLALAYAAAANGGVLMHPQLVLEERSAGGRVVRRYAPQAVQRVCTERTAARLRRMMEAVVDSGTGKSARMAALAVAGKTGTAQKYDPEMRSYARGRYLSSFIGFAPVEGARLLGLVVIDEPRTHGYYGGEVAAPVFRHVLEDAQCMLSGPLGPSITEVAARPPVPAAVTVPDLRLLPWRAAGDELEGLGLRARARGRGARVVAQEPTAGTALERGDQVVLWLEAGFDSAAHALPDLRGLSARDALRLLSQRLVPAQVVGSGLVARQSPEPGTPLPLGGPCVLVCEPARPWPPARAAAASAAATVAAWR